MNRIAILTAVTTPMLSCVLLYVQLHVLHWNILTMPWWGLLSYAITVATSAYLFSVALDAGLRALSPPNPF